MNKEEPKEIFTEIGGLKTKIVLKTDAEKRTEQKRIDKLSSMRITLTYIESQNMEATPQKTIEIADEFLKWIEK